jgi:RND family efflux transporter MFP subunit
VKVIIYCLKALFPLALIGTCVYVSMGLIESRPKAAKKAAKERLLRVSTLEAELSDQQRRILLRGVAEARRSLELTPRVSGSITYVHPSLNPGQFYSEGTVLLKLDREDYENEAAQIRLDIDRLKSDLAIEQGEQTLVSHELALSALADELTPEQKSLALRQPQLQKLKAQIKREEIRLKQALLKIDRCEIRAPFNLIIRSKDAEVGRQVSTQTVLFSAVGADRYQLRLTLNSKDLSWLQRDHSFSGKVSAPNRPESSWLARFDQLLPEVDNNGLLPQLLMTVDKPLEQPPANRLLLGSYVLVEVDLPAEKDVFRLPVEALHRDSVWVVRQETLHKQPIQLLWLEEEHFVCRGLQPGDKIVSSRSRSLREGLKVGVFK